MAIEKGDLLCEPFRISPVIAVQEGEILTPRKSDALVACFRNPLVGLITHEAETRIVEGPYDFATPVGGAVVDNE
jgi:hypothetical protein